MIKIKKIIRGGGFLFLILALTGCTINLGASSQTKVDGGVFKSVDGGQVWEQKKDMPTVSGKPASIAGVDVRKIVTDPQDHNTIYLATEKNGIIYTYDGGENWRQFKDLRQGQILALAVDPKNKCILYANGGNKLFRSDDCGRFWKNPYFHQNAGVSLTDIVIDTANSAVVYLATTEGEILKSLNSGQSWKTVYRLKGASFVDLLIDPFDSRIIYAASAKKGIHKTIDGGQNWQSLGEGLKVYSSSQEFIGLAADQTGKNTLLLISKYGMLKTVDGGQTWTTVDILPGPKNTIIYSLAINPKNGKEIYYTTRTSLVKSSDGGASWSSIKLPTSRAVKDILIDPQDPEVIYLGAYSVKN